MVELGIYVCVQCSRVYAIETQNVAMHDIGDRIKHPSGDTHRWTYDRHKLKQEHIKYSLGTPNLLLFCKTFQ